MLLNISVDIFFMALQFLVWKHLSSKWLGHVSVINTLWLLMTGLSKLRPWELYLPSETTYCYVYLMLLVFNMTSIFLFRRRKRNFKRVYLDVVEKPNYILLGTALFSAVVLAYNVPKFWHMFLVGGFASLRSNYLAGDEGELHVGIFITWFISSLIIAGSILSVIQLLNTRSKKIAFWTLVINFVNVLMYVIITGGRFVFVMFFMAVAIEIWLHNKGNVIAIIKKNKKWLALVLVSFVVVQTVTTERSVNNMGFIGNIYVYFFATINLLDHFISSGVDPHLHELMYGENLIGGFTSPFIVISNKIFGTDFEIPLAVIQSSTSEFIYVSPHFWMNNNCTFLYGALRDFGVMGIVIYAFIWAYFLNWAYTKSHTKQKILGESLYVYSLVVSVLLLIEWMPCRPNILFTAIFIFVFYRINSKSVKLR